MITMRFWCDDLAEIHARIACEDQMRPRPAVLHAPRADESLAGWLLRVAEIKGEVGLSGILRSIGDERYGIEHLGAQVTELARAFGVPATALQAVAYIQEHRRRQWCVGFGGQRIRRSALSFTRPKICPACLKEDGIFRQVWDLRFYTDCARHRVQMITDCPYCRHRISWFRARAGLCDRCGGAYADAPTQQSTPEIMPLIEDIERVIEGDEPHSVPGLFEVTDPRLRLAALLETYLTLGRVVLRTWQLPTPPVAKSEPEPTRAVLRAAATVLDGTWDAFHQFLEVAIQPGAISTAKVPKILPYVYRTVFIDQRRHVPRRALLGVVQREVGRFFLKAHPDLVEQINGNLLLVKHALLTKDRVSMTEAQKSLGLKKERVLHLAAQLGIKPRHVAWAKGTLYFKRHEIEQMRAKLAARPELLDGPLVLSRPASVPARQRYKRRMPLLSVAQAAERFRVGHDVPARQLPQSLTPTALLPVAAIADRLGVSASAVTRMIRAGLFSRWSGNTPASQTVRVPVAIYGEFEKALAARVARTSRGRKVELVGLDAALRTARLGCQGVNLAKLLALILDGQIGPIFVRPGERGLARIALPRAEIERLVEQLVHARFAGWCDANRAIAILETASKDTLTHLKRKGLLHPRRDVGTGAFMYQEDELAQINRTYVRVSQILKQGLLPGAGYIGSQVGRTLTSLGIRPVMGREIDGCPLVYYRRADVLAARERIEIAHPRTNASSPQGRQPVRKKNSRSARLRRSRNGLSGSPKRARISGNDRTMGRQLVQKVYRVQG